MNLVRSRFHFFFFNDTATTEIYTLSLHDALPIFLAGLGGAQFAQPGAVDRLRALRESGVLDDPDHLAAAVLVATDPANPYGAALPWPAPAVASAPKPMRSAGARVILVDGMLAA